MRKIVDYLVSLAPSRARKSVLWALAKCDERQFRQVANRKVLAPDPYFSLEKWKSLGFSPSLIVDIGAYEGNWSRRAREIWPDADLLMLEGNPAKFDGLQYVAHEICGEVRSVLLGSESGRSVDFYVMESGSSVLPENSPLERSVLTLQTSTLDEVVGELVCDFIKIDVQGYELDVLAGGSRTLRRAEAVLIEVSVIEVNAGAPLMHEVVRFMDEAGFIVADVIEMHARPLDGATNQVDLLFLSRRSRLLADKRHYA